MSVSKIRLIAALAAGAAVAAVPLVTGGIASASAAAPASGPVITDVGAQLAHHHALHMHHLAFLAQLDQEIQTGG